MNDAKPGAAQRTLHAKDEPDSFRLGRHSIAAAIGLLGFWVAGDLHWDSARAFRETDDGFIAKGTSARPVGKETWGKTVLTI